jgi:hypothetical protein
MNSNRDFRLQLKNLKWSGEEGIKMRDVVRDAEWETLPVNI